MGVPLKIALSGIDRYFERYYRAGPRRRPVKIDFCEADVIEAFDAWRRALGLPADTDRAGESAAEEGRPRPASSLRAHLERVVMRLTQARATGAVDERFDALAEAVARELDRARASPHGLRGAARDALIARLLELDGQLAACARAALDEATRREVEEEADRELSPFRGRLPPESLARAREAALDRLVRERLKLPVIALL